MTTELDIPKLRAQADKYEAVVERVRGVHEVQGRDGNWNYDQYMLGMFNGLELAMCTLDDREPEFRSLEPETDEIPTLNDRQTEAFVAAWGRGEDPFAALEEPDADAS